MPALMSSPDDIWASCSSRLAQRVPPQPYKTWFGPIEPRAFVEQEERCELHLGLPSLFYQDWLNGHYSSLLNDVVDEVVGEPTSIIFEVESRASEPEPAPTSSSRRASEDEATDEAPSQERSRDGVEPTRPAPIEKSTLSGAYTFKQFIQGDCNELAYSAARAIADKPSGSSYNPFLVYGGVGLGKTHLVQAIGNAVQDRDRLRRVRYVSSETFTSQFVQAIKNNSVASFSAYYRSIDLLIVDDVQFFGGKEKTQEEFFHVFNELYQQGRQIVLCADRAPRDISGIEDRLLSRFRWGLSADMQAPDLETRTAILQHKAETHDISLPGEVVDFIANRITENVRNLEGALNRLVAYAKLHREPIDLAMTREALYDVIDDAPARLKIDDVQKAVADYYDMPLDRMLSRSRKQEIVMARQVAMFLCKQFTQHTLKEIGMRFGGRDHSTVIHACKTVEARCETEADYDRQIEETRKLVQRAA